MDATQSVGLEQSYVSCPDILVFKYWIHSMFLFWDTVTKTGCMSYCYVKFFSGGYMHMGVLCDCSIAILNHSDAKQPFVTNTFPFL